MLRRRYHAHGDKGADAVETKSSHFSPYFAEFYLAPRERSRENSNRASKKQEKRLETYPRLFSSSLSPTPFLLLWGRILSPLSPCSLSYCSRFPHCPAMRSEASHLNEDLDASTPLHYVAWPEFICLWVPYFVGILSLSLSLSCATHCPLTFSRLFLFMPVHACSSYRCCCCCRSVVLLDFRLAGICSRERTWTGYIANSSTAPRIHQRLHALSCSLQPTPFPREQHDNVIGWRMTLTTYQLSFSR